MQALIPLIAGLSLVAGAQQLNLPYIICPGCPLLVGQQYQYQNTRTGEHAYSYAGGPSAKEEMKGADGVVRGSYSYVDAYGVPQSVFYVADDYGFRVAATDLPTDSNPSSSEARPVLLVRIEKPEEQSKLEEPGKPSRAKRSLDIGENQSEKKKIGDGASVKTILTPEATLVPDLPLSVSHQSQVQIHKGVSVDSILAKPLLKLEPQAFYQPLILHGEIPLAVSHQSQVQIHKNANAKLSGVEDKPIDVLRLPQILQAPTLYESLPVLTSLSPLPSYHENRIQLHQQLGIEGAKLKNTVKINSEPLALVESPVLVAEKAVPVLQQTVPQVIAKQAAVPATASVTTSISEHGISQTHPSAKVVQPLVVPSLSLIENAVPVVPLVNEAVPAAKLATATVTTSVSSHGVSQIHGASKINAEPTLLTKTAPLAQVHVFGEPVYLR